MAAPARCGECGAGPAEGDVSGPDGVPWTWSTVAAETDQAGRQATPAMALCAACTRHHARSIEAKLDHHWW